MILEFDKLSDTQVKRNLRNLIASSTRNKHFSIWDGVVEITPSKTKGKNHCQKFSYSIDIDKLFEKVKGQEGKYYAILRRVNILLDEYTQKGLKDD